MVRRWRAGDMHAAVELLQGLRPELLRLLRRRAGAAADDLLQDTYLAVLRSTVRFRTQGDFRSFALTVARRIARDRAQRLGAGDVCEPDGIAAREPSAFVLIERRQASALLALAVAELPEEQRSCLRLLLGGGRTPAEIASELGVSLSTVATRLARAKLRLGVALSSLRPG